MKTQRVLTFSITPPPIEFNLPIKEFDPRSILGDSAKFTPEINGPADCDGITNFQTLITKASHLKKDDGLRLLFSNGLDTGRNTMTGEDKIKNFANLPSADPDLLFSLYLQPEQKILQYFYSTYGITYIESVRRVILHPSGALFLMYVCRYEDGKSWACNCSPLGKYRVAHHNILLLNG